MDEKNGIESAAARTSVAMMTAGMYEDLGGSISVSTPERFVDGLRDAGLGVCDSGTMSSTYPIDLSPWILDTIYIYQHPHWRIRM